jgi:DtxR family Mn-dependent transcriptional regulator
LETYLSQRLGYSWDDVHAEAERLEHAASDELIERMASALEYPSHDPHGAPIPTTSGAVDEPDHPTLAEVDSGRRLVVRAVRDDDGERLRYMETRGLVPGAVLEVEARAPFNGPIALRIGERGVLETIGYELATQIRVSYLEG